MTYTSCLSKRKPRRGRSCHADRVATGLRFVELYRSLGMRPEDVAQVLHVSVRTVHNWRSGVHPVPFMAFKLLRVQRYMELPFPGWEGWRFVGGKLVSPEGRSFVGTDSSWWSSLIRRAHLFGVLYARQAEGAGRASAALHVPAPEAANGSTFVIESSAHATVRADTPLSNTGVDKKSAGQEGANHG